MRKLLLITGVICVNFGAIQAQVVHATYIANEGIFIESANGNILIDGLFDEYYDYLASPPLSLTDSLINGDGVYNNIDFCLVTHTHADHFDPSMTIRMLENHIETTFISTAQAYDSLSSELEKSTYADRVKSLNEGVVSHQQDKSGITIQSFFAEHIGENNKNILNLCFMINIAGKKILHMGDSDTKMELFDKSGLYGIAFEVAFVPVWMLLSEEGKEIITKHVNTKQLVAIHFPNVGGEMMLKGIQQQYPDAIVFTEVGQRVEF